MQRTSVTLSDDLAHAMKREARRRSVSVSELMRQALTQELGLAGPGERRVLPFVGIGHGDGRAVGREMEELLASEWGDPARHR